MAPGRVKPQQVGDLLRFGGFYLLWDPERLGGSWSGLPGVGMASERGFSSELEARS